MVCNGKIAGLIILNLKFDMNIKLVAIILIACSLLLLLFQYPCLLCVLGYLKVAMLEVGIPKLYTIVITSTADARNFQKLRTKYK